MTETATAGGPLPALLDRAVQARPHQPAVRDGCGVWSYDQLGRSADSVAHWLHAQGVRPGDRVAVRLGNVREFVALFWGTLRAGAVFVPVNPAMKPFHLASVLRDCGPALAVADDPAAGELRALAPCPVHGLSAVPASPAGPVPGPAAVPGTRTPDDALALLIYTSGSTSAPKAVVSPQPTVVFAAEAIASCLRYGPDDVVLTAVPLAFDYGLYQILLCTLATAELVLTDSPTDLLAPLRTHRVTVLPLVPSLAEILIRLAGRDGRPLPDVRMVTNTGATLAPQTIAGLRRALPGAAVVPMFGITECKRVTVMEPDGDLHRPLSVGRPLPGTEVLITDEQGQRLPAGETGEIVVRGPHVMAGYWNAPHLTEERFPVDPKTGGRMLRTGDYGRLDEDGYLYFQGRRDDMFKRRGVRMSALEIEAAAMDIPGVRACAVLPPADGADLVCYVVGDVTPLVVLTGLDERLEAAKVPQECYVVSELPLTPNGKTDKRLLADHAPAR